MLRIGSFLRLLVYIFEIIGIGSFFLAFKLKGKGVIHGNQANHVSLCRWHVDQSHGLQDQGLDANIFAVPVPEAKEYLQNNAVDVLLLGPQVRYLKNEFSADLSTRGIPVEVIPMTDYGMMKGDKVLALAVSLMG